MFFSIFMIFLVGALGALWHRRPLGTIFGPFLGHARVIMRMRKQLNACAHDYAHARALYTCAYERIMRMRAHYAHARASCTCARIMRAIHAHVPLPCGQPLVPGPQGQRDILRLYLSRSRIDLSCPLPCGRGRCSPEGATPPSLLAIC